MILYYVMSHWDAQRRYRGDSQRLAVVVKGFDEDDDVGGPNCPR